MWVRVAVRSLGGSFPVPAGFDGFGCGDGAVVRAFGPAGVVLAGHVPPIALLTWRSRRDLVGPTALVQPRRGVLGEFRLPARFVAVALSASDDLGGRGLLEGRGPRLAGPLLRLLQRVDRPELQPVGVIVAAGLGGALRLRCRRRN